MAEVRLNLARKYRPHTLADVIGQAAAVRLLSEAINTDRISPAYIFSGPRGTGKTTCARIFARAVSCLGETRPCEKCASCLARPSLDIREIDGASHTGVDDVRSIIESVGFRPSLGRRTVYIIDEVHMLSNAAFNALLKTLEEPPAHILFLLATTEIDKIPATVLSRCQRIEMRRLNESEIQKSLSGICKTEAIEADSETLHQISVAAEGSLRDAQTLLEQMLLLSGSKKIDSELVERFLGSLGVEGEVRLLETLASRNADELLSMLNSVYRDGKDLSRILSRLVHWAHGLVLARATKDASLIKDEFSPERIERLTQAFRTWSLSQLDELFENLWMGRERIRKSEIPRVTFESTLLRSLRCGEEERAIAEPARQKSMAASYRSSPAPTPVPETQTPLQGKAESKEDILALVKKHNPRLYALLVFHTQFSIKDGNLEWGFPKNHFAFKQLSENKASSELSEIFQAGVLNFKSFRLIEGSSAAGASAVPKPRVDFMTEAKKSALSDPLVRRAAEMFEGKVESVTIEGIKS